MSAAVAAAVAGGIISSVGGFLGGKKAASAAKEDLENAYVKVGTETIKVSSINDFQRKRIIKKIKDNGQVPTEQLIAQMRVFGGKSKIDDQFEWDKYNLEKGNTSTSSLK